MRAPGQSVDEAARKASDFIGSQRDKARQIQGQYERGGGTGMSKEALAEFGKALHTVTDMTSPAHEGFQVWYGLPIPGDTNFARDALSAKAHADAESAISYDRLGYAVGAAAQLYSHTFGEDKLQQATGGIAFGSNDDPSVQQIKAEFSLPGADPAAEGEALYNYRQGLRRGFALNWKH
jgi:hypothetical protein